MKRLVQAVVTFLVATLVMVGATGSVPGSVPKRPGQAGAVGQGLTESVTSVKLGATSQVGSPGQSSTGRANTEKLVPATRPPNSPYVTARPLLGLNNGFGRDARTERIITWVDIDRLGWTAASVQCAPDGSSLETAPLIPAAKTKLGGALGNYRSYSATLTGLTPGTRYNYRLRLYPPTSGDARNQEYSTVSSFTTAPAAPAVFTFLALADSQGTTSTYVDYWGNTLSHAVAAVPDAAFILQTGDLVDKSSSRAQVRAWIEAAGQSLTGTAFNPVLGNHDAGKAQAEMYSAMFPRGQRYGLPVNYAFTYGNTIFFNINSNGTSKTTLRRQGKWIKRRAAAFRAKQAGDAFVVVTLHKSPFGGIHAGKTVKSKGELGARNLRRYLVPYLAKAKVDLVIAGHDHNYIRTFPMRKTVAQRQKPGGLISSRRDGLIYFIPHNSGEKTYPLVKTSATERPWINRRWSPGSQINDPADTVFSTITVSATAITVNAYTTGSETRPRQLIDSFTINHARGP